MVEHLLIDLGGTHCRVGLADHTGTIPQSVRKFINDDFPNLTTLLSAYLEQQTDAPVASVCAAVAGPVRGNTAQLTNHSWRVDAEELQNLTGAAHVQLMNDLQAQAYALDDLPATAKTLLIPGAPELEGPRMVLCLGTGCNIAVAHRHCERIFVPASESGHTALPDMSQHHTLLDSLRAEFPHMPIEAILCASGLSRLHAHLTGEVLSSEHVVARKPDDTLRIFIDILGICAGNLCLANMATGGMYIIGGLARAIAPHLTRYDFKTPFAARGPYEPILQDIPISVINDDTAALYGCAYRLRLNANNT